MEGNWLKLLLKLSSINYNTLRSITSYQT
uniref:Uncharacterized protein n=1 Tax=Rhizophora mucronata TaxID=61149 RepID=A0A2P2NXV6_RHIMU